MAKLSELGARPPKIMVMGDFGTGKTALALTLGRHAKVFDFDDGLRTGLSLKDKFLESRKNVEVVSLLESDPKEATAFMKFQSYIGGIVSECRAGTFGYRAVVVDGYTNLLDAAVRNTLKIHGKLGRSPEIQQWGAAFIDVDNVLFALKTLPLVVVLLCHTRRVFDSDGGVVGVELATPGKNLPQKVPSFFDEVWRLDVSAGKYVIQTQASFECKCRSRSCVPDKTSVDLGLPEIMRQWMGYDIDKEVKKEEVKMK